MDSSARTGRHRTTLNNICHSPSSDDSLHSGHRFTGKVLKYLLRELAAAALAPNTCRQ
jgi:hypothetical protein